VRFFWSIQERKNIGDRVDYALFGPEGIHAVVEAKQIGRDLGSTEDQIRRYIRLFDSAWGLLTNGEEYRIYKSNNEGHETHVESTALPNLSSSENIQNLARSVAYPEEAQAVESNDEATFSDEVKKQIVELSSREDIYETLVESFAPTVYGRQQQKLAILFALFGGIEKQLPDGSEIRGAPHILFVAEPKTRADELVRYASIVAPRGIYLSEERTGVQSLNSSTHPGVPVVQETSNHSFSTLSRASHAIINRMEESDGKIIECLNDAAQAKVPESDPASGEVDNRTTGIIATSLPDGGRFDQYRPMSEQVTLEPNLTSCFDLIFTQSDHPDDAKDRQVADHILDMNHVGEVSSAEEEIDSSQMETDEVGSAEEAFSPPINPELLRRYIAYARRNCHPQMTEEAKVAIRKFYVDLRSDAMDRDAPVPASSRKLEVIVRIAEASARIRLSDKITELDADRAIEIIQSSLWDLGINTGVEGFGGDESESGTSEGDQELTDRVENIIGNIEEKYEEGAPVERVIDHATELGIDRSKMKSQIEKLKQKGEVYEPATDHLRTT